MKKHLLKQGLILLGVLLVLPFSARGAETRKLTVMIYMCGSNLESGYGSASLDLREIQEAEFGKNVSVLVMTGGSDVPAGTGYFRPDSTDIYEFAAGGHTRRISQEERKRANMGETGTLASFLRFGTENRPAEDYALILWNHGGGPVEGVCWDELFSMDCLSLPELADALAEAELPRKLKWIGFDACLMDSLEVACTVSPFAEYMIASQETEPAFGWNYSFLTGIENDETGAETGRRIVDAYFEGQEDYEDDMTLACLDLSKTDAVQEAMDTFFASPELAVTPETFSLQAGRRGSMTGFGKAVSSTGEDGFDLVDAAGLVRSFRTDQHSGEELLKQLDEMVVYSRDNGAESGGVSLYYPYANKTKYAEKWHDEYARLHFSEGYTSYISSFGDLLTGRPVTDWSGLLPEEAGFGDRQEPLFSLRLTPKQAENCASARIMILNDLVTGGTLEENCALIYTGEAKTGDDGALTAGYSGKALYIEQENGSLYGPVAFGLTQDGSQAFVRMVYLPEGVSDTEQFTHVVYYLETESGAEYPGIARTRVWDRATETFTNRIQFDESRYAAIHLVETGRVLPDPDEQGLLPAYDRWPDGPALIGGLDINLPNRWRFHWVDEPMSGKQLYAVFQLTDIQQNVFCTMPVPVSNNYRREYSGTAENAGPDSPVSDMTATVIHSPREVGAVFEISIENREAADRKYEFSGLTINGSRRSAQLFSPARTVAGNTAERIRFTMQPEELYGLERIETVSLTLTVNGDEKEIPIRFRFENCESGNLWQDIQPAAETEQNGVRMQLLSLKPYMGSGIQALAMVTNDRAEELIPENAAVIGGIMLQGDTQNPVPAGTSSLRSFNLSNSISAGGYELETTDGNPNFYLTDISDHLLQHRGITEITEMTLYARASGEKAYGEAFTLRPDTPWKLRDGDASTYLNTSVTVRDPEEDPMLPARRAELAENNQYAVACEKILIGRNGIALGLEITNRTAFPLTVYARNFSLNGKTARIGDYLDHGSWEIAPGAVRIAGIVLLPEEADLPLEELESIGIGFESEEQRKQRQEGAACVIRLPEPRSRDGTDAVWIQPDSSYAEKTVMEETDSSFAENEDPAGTEQLLDTDVAMPENARNLTRWIPANLTEEQAERAESGSMSIFRKTADGAAAALVSLHKMIRGEDGGFGTRFAGFLLTPENSPDVPVYAFYGWPNRDHLNAVTLISLSGYDDGLTPFRTAESITVRVDFTENRAEIAEQDLTGEDGAMSQVLIPTIGRFFPEGNGDLLPPVMEWKSGTEIRFVKLDGKPLRFVLRPVTAEDELYVIFTVKEKNGTEYSLPPFPYPAEEAGS